MHLLRFKCKVTGHTFQEVDGRGGSCASCAFKFTKIENLGEDAFNALVSHCLAVPCIERGTYFVEVTE